MWRISYGALASRYAVPMPKFRLIGKSANPEKTGPCYAPAVVFRSSLASHRFLSLIYCAERQLLFVGRQRDQLAASIKTLPWFIIRFDVHDSLTRRVAQAQVNVRRSVPLRGRNLRCDKALFSVRFQAITQLAEIGCRVLDLDDSPTQEPSRVSLRSIRGRIPSSSLSDPTQARKCRHRRTRRQLRAVGKILSERRYGLARLA